MSQSGGALKYAPDPIEWSCKMALNCKALSKEKLIYSLCQRWVGGESREDILLSEIASQSTCFGIRYGFRDIRNANQ